MQAERQIAASSRAAMATSLEEVNSEADHRPRALRCASLEAAAPGKHSAAAFSVGTYFLMS